MQQKISVIISTMISISCILAGMRLQGHVEANPVAPPVVGGKDTEFNEEQLNITVKKENGRYISYVSCRSNITISRYVPPPMVIGIPPLNITFIEDYLFIAITWETNESLLFTLYETDIHVRDPVPVNQTVVGLNETTYVIFQALEMNVTATRIDTMNIKCIFNIIPKIFLMSFSVPRNSENITQKINGVDFPFERFDSYIPGHNNFSWIHWIVTYLEEINLDIIIEYSHVLMVEKNRYKLEYAFNTGWINIHPYNTMNVKIELPANIKVLDIKPDELLLDNSSNDRAGFHLFLNEREYFPGEQIEIVFKEKRVSGKVIPEGFIPYVIALSTIVIVITFILVILRKRKNAGGGI